MSPRGSDGGLRPEFVTIYFLQGAGGRHKIAVRLVRVVLGGILLIFGAVCLRVWQEMQIVKLGYACGELKTQCQRLQAEQRSLLSQRNALAGLQRVESVARAELGLQTPDRGQVIFLDDPAAKPRGFAGWWGGRGAAGPLWAWLRPEQANRNKEAGLGGQDH